MNTFKEKLALINPLTWPAWILIGLLWLLTRLPIQWQFALGRSTGRLIYRLSPKIRHITETNIKLCFPELTDAERTTLIQKNVESLGLALVETAMAWWLPEKKLARCQVKVHGHEHVLKALEKGKGIILVGPHTLCLEIAGRLLGARYDFAVMFRPHKKKFIANLLKQQREKYGVKQIARSNMRDLLRTLQDNVAVWYAYDVDGGEKRSVFAPLFGIQTASLTALSRVASMTDAEIIPLRFYRVDEPWGYDIVVDPPLENFPSESFEADATRVNQYIESAIRANPEQYIWQYKRFKTRPAGEARFY